VGARIRVLIVDDHAMVRRGMRDFLDLHHDLKVVGEASDGVAALEATAALLPDVVVMEEDRIEAAIEAGASGFPLKDAEADDLAAAIRSAHGGDMYLDPAVAGIVARRLRSRARGGEAGPPTSAGLDRLTSRERDVLGCLARGPSNRAIAEELGMAERTARTHVSNILAKLGLASRTQAALLAIEHLPDAAS
jgi:DNA-binding NarL/FixJ family response regulator